MNSESEKVIKKKCGALIAEFIKKYGCQKTIFCRACQFSLPTLKRIEQGDENVKIDSYIRALYFIGIKYLDALKLCNV